MIEPMLRALVLMLAIATSANAEVNVYAAASLTDVLTEVAVVYERSSRDRIVFNFGGSSMLARQIQEGAPADVFISADEEKMNALQRRGLIDHTTRVSHLSNSLVLVVPKGAAALTPQQLATNRVRYLVLADPRSVPAGIYAETWLRRVGLWNEVKPKVIPTENVRAALAAVEAGNADAAIVYKTDAMRSRDVRVVHTVNGNDRPTISYPFAAVRSGGNHAAARQFLTFLGSKPALEIFRRHGFDIISAKK